MSRTNQIGLADEMAAECIDLIQDISGVILTNAQLAVLFEAHEDLVNEIVDWGADDTVTSERIADVLSEFLLDRSWPAYGQKADLDAFISNLRVASVAKGYKVAESA